MSSTTSIEALTAELDNLLLKTRELEAEILETDDEATSEKLERRLQKYYGFIKQRTDMLQSLKSGDSSQMTPPATPPPSSPATAPKPAQRGKKELGKWTVFMSYCWLNSREAAELKQTGGALECGPCDPRQLARQLSDAGFPTWLDVDRLDDATPLYDELVTGILPSKCVVACISDAYIKSKNCNLEFKYVHKLQIPMVLVIVGSEKCDWSRSSIGFIAGDLLSQYIDATSASFSNIVDRVKEAVARHTEPTATTEPPPKDPLEDLEKAAEAGDMQAQYQLAVTFDPTQGTDHRRNAKTATHWYTLAAKQGHTLAQYNSGLAYKYGRGVEEDEDRMIEWFDKASRSANPDAQFELGLYYQSEDNTPTAAEWFQEAAEQGHMEAQAALGYCYKEGVGVEEDGEEAVKWYRKAAEQGHVGAMVEMGKFYEEGEWVERSRKEAMDWFGAAAKEGSTEAVERLKRLKFAYHG
ncbi:Leucine-rich repeat serine/threonine-protein kinase 2 [Rhizophlyctis rosea]|nr:Leucine-rich repeat serine/threonine-protein kinase 2 [Rhizophlyctis rosea]